MKDDERRSILIDLWHKKYPPHQRTGTDLLIFYGWLEMNRPELLKHGHGNPYQQLKVDLRGEWQD